MQAMSSGLAASPNLRAKPGYVLVECVWPPERGAKNDCRGKTGVVWNGHGDVQEYPAVLWPKLAEHPGVWRLFDAERAAKQVAAAEVAARAKITEEVNAAALAAASLSDAERQAASLQAQAAAARDLGQSSGTDVITLVTSESAEPPAVEAKEDAFPPMKPPFAYTEEHLKAMTVDEIREVGGLRGYGLHPRLTTENLIARFLEAQANTGA